VLYFDYSVVTVAELTHAMFDHEIEDCNFIALGIHDENSKIAYTRE
jgi:hypothetical protein